MEQWEREYYVSRIIAGEHRLDVCGRTFEVKNPSRNERYISNKIFKDTYLECKKQKIMTTSELSAFMLDRALWNEDQDKELEQFYKNIEELKVGLYEKYSEDNARFSIKHGLDVTNKEINRLLSLKNRFDHLSCESIAMAAKLRYLVGVSINYPNYDSPGEYTEEVMNKYFEEKISEKHFREISRTDPWLSYWTTKSNSGSGLFGEASVDLNDERRTVMMWSVFYDSVKDHDECPDDKIINDDDALDGWVIVQRRKRKKEKAKSRLDSVGSKIKNSDEVFLMARNQDEYEEINSLNDPNAQRIIKQRWSHIEQNKEVKEGHLPDTIQRLQMQAAQIEAEKMRSRR